MAKKKKNRINEGRIVKMLLAKEAFMKQEFFDRPIIDSTREVIQDINKFGSIRGSFV